MDGRIKLAGFPVGHADAAVRSGFAREITLMQSVAGRKLDEIRHWGAHEMGMGRLPITPDVHVGLDDNVVGAGAVSAVNARAMIQVLPNDREMACWSAMPLTTA